MASEEILLKIIELLKEKGFEHFVIDKKEWWKDKEKRIEALEKNYYYALIFDIKFAQFAWPEGVAQDGSPLWMFNLVRMALAQDKMWYLDLEFLRKQNN